MNKPLKGSKLIDIRLMTPAEQEHEGWDNPATILVFDNGDRIYASGDEEGNGEGALFGLNSKGKGFYIFA